MRVDPLIEVLQTDFPEVIAPLGARQHRPTDERRFRAALTAIALRLRRRYNFIMGVVIFWFLALIGVALLSSDPYTHVIGVATTGFGTGWCIALLVKLGREVFAIDTLLALAARREADLSDLVALCRELVRTPVWAGLVSTGKPAASAAS